MVSGVSTAAPTAAMAGTPNGPAARALATGSGTRAASSATAPRRGGWDARDRGAWSAPAAARSAMSVFITVSRNFNAFNGGFKKQRLNVQQRMAASR